MKITNKHNLPEAIHKWLCQNNYDGTKTMDNLSATTLLKPIQEILLTKRHDTDIEQDCIDSMWSVFGSAIHFALESLDEKAEPIERLSVTIDGIDINGKFDRIINNEIYDYKCTKAWSMAFGDKTDDWCKQLSVYRYLYREIRNVALSQTGYIIAIFRDWEERNVCDKFPRYPKLPMEQIPIHLLSFQDTEKWIKGRVAVYKSWMNEPDEKLPDCTDEERWYQAKTKKYNKCAKYCLAKQFCKQAQSDAKDK